MFVQVIQGHVDDPAQLREQLDTWVRDVAPGAIGWLGSTSGVTEDGRAIAIARFESEEAAQQNSARPEQDHWWSHMAAQFKDEPTFAESSDIMLDLPGDPDRAGFVQVMRGQGREEDSAKAREIMGRNPERWREARPEILGQVSIAHPGGAWTMVIYFTSEADARAGEQKELPPELAAEMEEMNSMMTSQPEFFDLKDPWIESP
jgi:hypothetical protein